MRKYAPKDCIGLVFRARINQFQTSGGFKETRDLRLLKRKSCPGCKNCTWLLEQLSEHVEWGGRVDLSKLEDQLLYKLEAHVDTDEYGNIDNIDWEFVEISESDIGRVNNEFRSVDAKLYEAAEKALAYLRDYYQMDTKTEAAIVRMHLEEALANSMPVESLGCDYKRREE
jgi:hypothetical protein